MEEKTNALDFFEFIYDRQAIWHNRFIQGKPRDLWTEDKTLKTYRFCNIYRRLDRGTQYLVSSVLDEMMPLPQKFLNIIGYRFFNIDGFFEDVMQGNKFSVEHFAFKKYEALMDEAKERQKIFSMAYMTTQQPFNKEYRWGDKHVQILFMLQHVADNINQYMEPVFTSSPTAKKSCQALEQIKMIGAFIAYEIWTDLTYLPEFPYSDDDYANPGPGALWGLRLLYDREKIRKKEAQDMMKHLRDSQPTNFTKIAEQRDKDWEKVKWQHNPHGQYLSLRNIEHSLCEFRKYLRLSQGEGKKRYYKPK